MSSLQLFLASAPHKMVFISLFSLFILLYLIFIYERVFPKKRVPYTILLFGLSILPLISMLRPGSYESGDLTLHTARLMSFYKNLEEGNLIPRWAPDLNGSYGYALFSFIYPLPYYTASFFHFIGAGFLDSVKILLAFSYIASGFAMFYWLKNHVRTKNAFLGSVFYLFAPYHLVDMHFRVDIGEALAFLFLPATFLCIDRVVQRNSNYLWVFFGGLSLAALILSHPAISLLGFFALALYALFVFLNTKDFIGFRQILLIFLSGLAFSGFYWIPVILESKFTYGSIVQTELEFHSLSEFIFSPWRGGLLFQGPKGELSLAIGYAHLAVIVFSLYLILKRKTNLKLLFFMSLFILSIFLAQKNSSLLWEKVSILQRMLLTYRVLVVSVFAASAAAALLMEIVKGKKIYYLLLSVAVLTTILNWGNRKNVPGVKDNEISHMLSSISYEGECFWPAIHLSNKEPEFCHSAKPASKIEAVNSKLQLLYQNVKSEYRFYDIQLEQNSLIKENTAYFPGWRLYVNSRESEIDFENENFPGIITFQASRGRNRIELVFEDTPIRKLSIILSLAAFFMSGVMLLVKNKGALSTIYRGKK